MDEAKKKIEDATSDGGSNKPPDPPQAPSGELPNPGNIKKIPKNIIKDMGGEKTIKQIKRETLGSGTNPDLHWDPRTGEIYAPKPGGGFEPTGYNVNDFIK